MNKQDDAFISNEQREIPLYGLYGESLVSTDPGLVHIEDISERSQNLGWVIKPHRHSELLQVLCIFKGKALVSLNGQSEQLMERDFVVVPSGVVHSFRFEPYVEGFVLTLDNSVMDMDRSTALRNLAERRQASIIHAQTKDAHFQRFLHYVDLIKEESNQHHSDQNGAMTSLAQLAIISMYRSIKERHLVRVSGEEESQTLSRFKALLEKHYREHWSVGRYAEQLHVSTSTLSRLCHQFAGASPKSIIQQRLIAESRRRLMYTRQSIEDIAHTLGFKDQAYFSRFFKKLQGQSPAHYRKTEYR